MQAINIIPNAEGGNRLQLGQHPTPEPAAGQVLLKIHAAGVNRPDLMQRQGGYPPPPGASPILGLEAAGEIVALGPDVADWHIGDAVCALLTGGGYAEYGVAAAGSCLPPPAGLNWLQAASLPETYFTVWYNLFMRGGLKAGESVLIHGGGGGIGVAAIQLAKAFGAAVFTTAGGAEKCARCLALGADAAIDYRAQDFVEAVADLTQGRGVNLIMDIIGGDYFPKNLACLAEEGRLAQVSVQGGVKAEINLWRVMQKRLTITGSTLRGRDPALKAEIARQLRQHVWPLFARGEIKPIIDSIYPLAEAEAAHARLSGGQHFGKIILEV